MAAISTFCVTQHNQIFSVFFRNRIQCTARYQLHNSQALLNLRRGYFKLSGQMVKSLGKSIIHMYSMGASAALGISNQDALSEDLENDPFLNSALQRFTCELYYRFGSFLAPLSVGLITSKHYLSQHSNKMEERVEMTEKPTTMSLGTAMAAELMIGFWFGIGAILAIKMVHSLEELISSYCQ